MSNLQNLMRSGKVQLSDRREHPRFRFRGPVEVIAVDVVGAIVPTDISGWTTDVSAVGAVVTLQQQLTNKGLFIRFANSDELVMPASIIRTLSEQSGFYTYAVEFASIFDNDKLVQIMSFEPAPAEGSDTKSPAQQTATK
jgi:hypothetical protein